MVVDIPSVPQDLFIFDTDATPDGGVLLSGMSMEGGEGRLLACRFDPTGQPAAAYGIDGRFVSPASFGSLNGRKAAVAPDGSVVMAGCYANNGIYQLTFMRVLPDGQVDPDFGDQGLTAIECNMVIIPGDLELAPDGSVYVTGRAGAFAFIMHIGTDGQLDTLFGDDGLVVVASPDGQNLSGNNLELAPEGYMLISGPRYSTHTDAGFMAAYDLVGSPVTWFGDEGFLTLDRYTAGTESWEEMSLLADGKVLLSGSHGGTGITSRVLVLLLNQNGSPDPAFGIDGMVELIPPAGVRRSVPSVYRLSSGHVLLTGLQNTNGNFNKVYLTRLTISGAIDPSFGTDGTFTDAPPQNYAILMENMGVRLTDGRFVVAGYGAYMNDYGYGAMAYEVEELTTALNAPASDTLAPHVFPNPTTGEITLTGWDLRAETRLELRGTHGSLNQVWNAAAHGGSRFTIADHVADGAYILSGQGPSSPKVTIMLAR